ncbi:MAG: cyclase family protein [Gammaproteobacteria bacterium]|nr:cyclase family protein [Gammaproteobacteria bacterium]
MLNLVDLSHRVISGQQTYPGLPAPTVSAYLSHQDSRSHYTNGTEFHIGEICMVMNTGTYVDAPFHRYRNRGDISQIELQRLANLDGICFRTRGASLDLAAVSRFDVRNKAVLIHTGWSQHWGSPEYFRGHPFVTREAAAWLVQAGAAHVGIDSLNIDSIDGGQRPVHSLLLEADIPITEHLCNLDRIPEQGFRYFAVPVKVVGAGSFPVRAFALVP